MSGNFFSKFDSEYFSLIIFLKYLLILLLMLIFVTKMTLLEKNKICRTFRAVGHLGTLHTSLSCAQIRKLYVHNHKTHVVQIDILTGHKKMCNLHFYSEDYFSL